MFTYRRFRNGTVAVYWRVTGSASRRIEDIRARFRPIPLDERDDPPKPKGTWDWREPAEKIMWFCIGVVGSILGAGLMIGGASLMLLGVPWALETHHEVYIYALLVMLAAGSIFCALAANPKILAKLKEWYGD